MESTFNYREIPNGFLHCADEACTRSGDCLRHLAFKHIPEDKPYVSWLNPKFVARQENCSYFKSNALVCLALGITKLFDDLPHSKAKDIKKTIYDHFGHNTYYRIYNKKYFIKPEAQAFIREVFRKHGIENEPVFDDYRYCYEWTDDKERQYVQKLI